MTMKWVSDLWETIPGTPGQRTLTILLGVLSVLFIAVMVCKPVETCITQLLGTDGKYETLRALGFGMGGILVVLQLLIANRRAYAMEETAKAQAKATQEQAKANENTEQGQRQERLKNAIEHLGHESDSVRLGGAYELFHLAEDTEDLGQRQTVLDILCAHIRRTTGEPEYREKHRWKPSEEIQSLLTLLFVREHRVFTGRRISLQGSWLNGSDLKQARLAKADLVGAQLHEALLCRAQLHGARLIETRLHGALLFRAQLHGADLRGAELHRADLRRARLPGACLWGAELYGAPLWGAELQGTLLREAWFNGADPSGVQLHGASIRPGEPNEPFEALINRRIGKQSDLPEDIFARRRPPKDVALIGTGLPDEEAKRLRADLLRLSDKVGSQKLQEDNGAVTGEYTKEEAAQWIAEYKTATAEVAEGDS